MLPSPTADPTAANRKPDRLRHCSRDWLAMVPPDIPCTQRARRPIGAYPSARRNAAGRPLARAGDHCVNQAKGTAGKMEIVFLAVVLALPLLSVCLPKWLRHSSDSRLLRSLDDAPETLRIVVLGCPPRHRSGKQNRYFAGRIASAAAAYHHTAGRRILCSGRSDGASIDEASALADALETASVPRAAIDLDQHSERTIDSIDYVAAHHGNEPILFVTQPFHMSRVLYLARSRGLDAWGLIASGPAPGPSLRMREAMAELRAVLDVLR